MLASVTLVCEDVDQFGDHLGDGGRVRFALLHQRQGLFDAIVLTCEAVGHRAAVGDTIGEYRDQHLFLDGHMGGCEFGSVS